MLLLGVRTFLSDNDLARLLRRLCDREIALRIDCARRQSEIPPRELRLERVFDRGWNEEDFAAREAVQESLDLKRSRADATIDNSSSAEQTFAQVERFWKSLIG